MGLPPAFRITTQLFSGEPWIATFRRRGGAAPRNNPELGACLLVVYTGQSHFSAGNNWAVLKRRLDGDPQAIEAFDGIADAATALGAALEGGDLPAVGRLMSEEWRWRRRLAAGISTPAIEAVLEARSRLAFGAARLAGRGGGCVAMLRPRALPPRERTGPVLVSCCQPVLASLASNSPPLKPEAHAKTA
jgi:mevalonate kinase